LDKATNKLLRVYTIAAALMDKIDLNDDDNHKGWVSAYRKKIAQWRQRATKEATKVRDHWDDEEKNIMYQWANTFVKDKGIDMLTTKAVDGERNDLLDLLNKTIPGTRNAEGVSAWVKGQMKRTFRTASVIPITQSPFLYPRRRSRRSGRRGGSP
jgi:hypothetical protein